MGEIPGERSVTSPRGKEGTRPAVWLRTSPLCTSVSPGEGPARGERCVELNRVPQTSAAEPESPGPRKGPVSADGASEGCDYVKRVHEGGPRPNLTGVLLRRGHLDTRGRGGRQECMKRGRTTRGHSKEVAIRGPRGRRGLRGNQLSGDTFLDLGLPASETETQMPAVTPSRPRHCVTAAWERDASGPRRPSDAEAFLRMKSNRRKPDTRNTGAELPWLKARQRPALSDSLPPAPVAPVGTPKVSKVMQ